MTFSENNFSEELTAAKEAAQKARHVLLNHFGRLTQVSEKFQAGLVSEADRAAEKAIQTHLEDCCPQHHFLGEEGTFDKPKAQVANGLDQSLWVVDPLDGTTNYIHRFPIFCISIGLVVNRVPMLGVIDVPCLNETYWAVRGNGAFKNGEPLKVSSTQNMKRSLSATGFNVERPEHFDEQLRIFANIAKNTRGVRRPGAAAFDLCMVASGVFDFFWEKLLSPWDVAAGQVLVEEAGGRTSTYYGEAYNPWCDTIIASNGIVHDEVLKIMAACVSRKS
jgi:myo-inositol-1(or 4)-monophosphatase